MRDDHIKHVEELKDKTNQTVTTNEQLDGLMASSPTTVNIYFIYLELSIFIQNHLFDL
jgi:hypothetical protein